MQSLDRLVSDIEEARNFPEESRCQTGFPAEACTVTGKSSNRESFYQNAAPSQQRAVECALAEITAQLSAQYDLHDTLV